MTRWVWFDEALANGLQLALEITEDVHREQTGRQELAIYDTCLFGRALALDGIIQITEKDEFIYSEMLAHVPILAHGTARQILIIGGGDGAVLEEVLKHRTVERASLVEIDPHVVDLSRTYLPSICKDAFDDPRTELTFADGAAFVASTELRPDVIIVDSTDPIGPGEVLFGDAFYRDCRRCLAPGGVMVTQSGVPITQGPDLTRSQHRLAKVFTDVSCYALRCRPMSAASWPLAGPATIRPSVWWAKTRSPRGSMRRRSKPPTTCPQSTVAHSRSRPISPNYWIDGLRCGRAASHATASASDADT